MVGLRILSAVAAGTLVLATVASASAAQSSGKPNPGGSVRTGGGAPAFRSAGAPAARVGGNPGYRGGPMHVGGAVHRNRGVFISGSVVGAVGFYDEGYYEDGPVAVNPAGGDDGVAWCMQTYRSYDPRSRTYVGFDGDRHPCP
jgi:hypothetical protein